MRTGILAMAVFALAANVTAQDLPLEVTAPWQITVGKTVIDVPPQSAVHVRGEKHAKLRVFAEKGGGWRRGERLKPLITQECTAAGALDPTSVKVRSVEGVVFELGKDYKVEGHWGTVGRVEGGGIGAKTPVLVEYDYFPNRLHALAVNAAGAVRLVMGKPTLGIQFPPDLDEGETRLAGIWLSGRVEHLSKRNLLPVDGTPQPVSEWVGRAAELIPETLAKLQAGEKVRIVAWGDSVTNGGGVGGRNREGWYQHQFLKRLKLCFPKAQIELLTASWPGGNSRGYMNAPPGGKYDFKRDVLAPKPDLVTIEFVNDAGWRGERLMEHYGKIRDAIRGNGSEIILITPHFVRPDWMGVNKSTKFDNDPRPYVKSLRDFARDNDIAVADAALLWGHLWREGIPYMTMEGNSINHPDVRGHKLFADALMAIFSERKETK
ncbi:MAG: SGNH/GDSL hydrolase family protein [Lentisphaeria bacterium]|nr:SGNH/GDSL hydrolase family protein [Lentisphaeria bacterium]